MSHVLTGIIVSVEEGDTDRDLRNKACYALEDFQNVVYDYYDETGGMWSSEYENNVIRATDDKFFEALDRCLASQKYQMEEYLSMMKEKNIHRFADYFGRAEGGHESYLLMCFAELLYGKFTYNSYVYDSEDYSSKITEWHKNKYKNNRESYAIVMVDLHS